MSPMIRVQFIWRTPAPPAGHMPTTSHSLSPGSCSPRAVAVACSLVLVLLARALCRSRRLHSVRRPSPPLPLSVRATDGPLVRPGSRLRPAPLRLRAAGRSLRGWRRPAPATLSRPRAVPSARSCCPVRATRPPRPPPRARPAPLRVHASTRQPASAPLRPPRAGAPPARPAPEAAVQLHPPHR
jgi:hypothetical protein